MSDPAETTPAETVVDDPKPAVVAEPAAMPADDHADALETPAAEPAHTLTNADRMKAKVRAVLEAQPFRGDNLHKSDLLAVVDALIDGPD